jgi:hypothetical protein
MRMNRCSIIVLLRVQETIASLRMQYQRQIATGMIPKKNLLCRISSTITWPGTSFTKSSSPKEPVVVPSTYAIEWDFQRTVNGIMIYWYAN